MTTSCDRLASLVEARLLDPDRALEAHLLECPTCQAVGRDLDLALAAPPVADGEEAAWNRLAPRLVGPAPAGAPCPACLAVGGCPCRPRGASPVRVGPTVVIGLGTGLLLAALAGLALRAAGPLLPPAPPATDRPTVLRGAVIGVDANSPEVRLSLGADDGVVVGLRFEISRTGFRGESVGTVDVVEVQPDGCRCRLVEGGPFRPGDEALAVFMPSPPPPPAPPPPAPPPPAPPPATEAPPGDVVPDAIPEAGIDGTVVQVGDLVWLSVGEDDRVGPATRFVVYRGPRTVALVQAVEVLRDSCRCRVLAVRPNEAIQPGDFAVSTR